MRATLLAMIIAGVLLVTIVLPAEYGLDPTGIGRALGLFRPAANDASVDAAGAGDDGGAVAANSAQARREPLPARSQHPGQCGRAPRRIAPTR